MLPALVPVTVAAVRRATLSSPSQAPHHACTTSRPKHVRSQHAFTVRLVPATMEARGAASGFAMLVLAALGITGAWGPICSWPKLLLSGRARAPGYGFFNSFAGW